LQQFISSSTWDYEAVRRNVARWAVEVVDPVAYVVDDTGFGKDGTASPCVARQYSGTLGKTGNCQIGVSVQMVTDTASLAANWRLFCPASWDDTTVSDSAKAVAIQARRADAGIPEQVRHREKWRLALDMIDQMIGDWGLPELPVVADSGYGDATAFRLGLAQRGLSYIVEVEGTASAHPHDATPRLPAGGRGRAAYPDKPANLRALALAAGQQALRTITWRTGTKATASNPTAAMRSRFLALRVRPANRDIPRTVAGTLPEQWLIVEWPPDANEPTKYWLSNMDTRTPPKTPGTPREDPLASRTRPPRTQDRPRLGSLRRPLLHRLAPPRHPRGARPSLRHPATPGPKSGCAGLTLYAVLRLLHRLLVAVAGACHLCNRPFDNTT
jgi:SRSO17 transposase